MPYQLTRPAANAASYSDRTAQIGKPIDTLHKAFRDAIAAHQRTGGPVTITDTDSGLWGKVERQGYANGPRAGTQHIALALPSDWMLRLIPGWHYVTDNKSEN
jgi:hypothetical protein